MTAPARAGSETVELQAAADTTLYQEDGNVSNGTGPSLFAGRTLEGLRRRALLRFDLAALPPGAVIESATLHLSVDRTMAEVVPVDLLPVLGAWGEGASDAGFPGGLGTDAEPGDATWTFRIFPDVAWNSPGGDTSATASARFDLDGEGDYAFNATPAMLADLQAWLDQPDANFGWQLRVDETLPPPTAKRLASREHPDPLLRPRLQLTFIRGTTVPDAVAVPAMGLAGGLLLAALAAALAMLTLRCRD